MEQTGGRRLRGGLPIREADSDEKTTKSDQPDSKITAASPVAASIEEQIVHPGIEEHASRRVVVARESARDSKAARKNRKVSGFCEWIECLQESRRSTSQLRGDEGIAD
jgi:hypothetical protein